MDRRRCAPQRCICGDWIHWQEQPELSIKASKLVRGGASDLYGSSAIGGVVNMVPVRPTSISPNCKPATAPKAPTTTACLLQTKRGPWGLLAAGGALGTDGYIQEAPSQRGPVDIASNVHSQNGIFLAEHDRGPLRLFVRGSGFNEARNNGTPVPDQRNPPVALRNRRGLARPASGTLVPAPLRINRALPPDLFQHLQSAHFCRSRLLVSLRRNPTRFRSRPTTNSAP